MRADKLPTLHNFIDNGFQLRTEAAKAISRVEIYRGRATIEPPAAAKLVNFFTVCAAAAGGTAVPDPDTSAVIEDGAAVTIGGTTYTFTVEGGAITGITVDPEE